MFKEIINKVQNKYRTHIEEIEKYSSLVEQSNVVSTLYAVPSFNKKDFTVSYKDILEECPNINESKAVVVRGLIPFYEVYLTVVYAKEVKTNTEYFLVPTSKGLWIINQDKYTKYLYEGLNVSIVKNNVTSKVINLSNIIFEVLGEAEIINKFINIINDLNYRNGLINEKISMFCGIVPTKSYINDIFSGISIDQYKNVVFHTSDFNYKYNIGEIENYELMLDDNVVSEKRSNRRVRMTANKNSCYEMNIRVTTKDKVFLVPIIKKSTFQEVYQSTSSVYMKGRSFAEEIMRCLDEMDEARLNGM